MHLVVVVSEIEFHGSGIIYVGNDRQSVPVSIAIIGSEQPVGQQYQASSPDLRASNAVDTRLSYKTMRTIVSGTRQHLWR